MKRFGFALTLLAVTVAFGARADSFIPNHQTWSMLSSDSKAGVVAGIADELQNPSDEDSAPRKMIGVGLTECFARLQLKAGALANAVESWYRADPQRQSAPAHIAFFGAVPGGLCKSFIETERKRQNL